MGCEVLIIGAFHEVIELAEDNGMEIVGLVDSLIIGSYRGYKIIGTDEDADIFNKDFKLIITPDLPKVRNRLAVYYKELGFQFAMLVSKEAKISRSALIEEGTIIQYGVNVSSDVKIGKFVKLNTNCNVMHNSIISDFTTIAPYAVILGNVKIGTNCYIGSNATILPNLELCENVVIGAGAVVTKSIADPDSVYAGIPAKRIK
jgi:sugar O-acyltransferase (sialic acid O-acetyltransferase NeuD family)